LRPVVAKAGYNGWTALIPLVNIVFGIIGYRSSVYRARPASPRRHLAPRSAIRVSVSAWLSKTSSFPI
jgi:radical SAM superfamily enzyme with C-terminal helix-hairpin-helix motif